MKLNISADEMEATLFRLFRKHNFAEAKAQTLARVHTDNSLHGVYSHGINRVPRFIDYVKKGHIKIDAEAEKVAVFGNIERWDGHFGPGVLNAIKCTNRAVRIAKDQGMGMVALRNTNHWMRAGAYGWQAAKEGCIAILFTNTQPNMPAWGGQDSRIGNNPLVVAIPREEGHVVLDMALSQFSFGKINEYKLQGKQLPYFGGWDEKDKLSKDPQKILAKERGLPIGYWKGSALSMVLDMLVTLLSAGRSTYRVGQEDYETGLSQVFLCIDPTVFHDQDLQEKLLNEIIDYTHEVAPMQTGEQTYYPGERALENKQYHLKEGMQVSKEVWEQVLKLLR